MLRAACQDNEAATQVGARQGGERVRDVEGERERTGTSATLLTIVYGLVTCSVCHPR